MVRLPAACQTEEEQASRCLQVQTRLTAQRRADCLASLNSVAKLPYEWALDGISNTQTINPDALGTRRSGAYRQPGTGYGRILRSGRSSLKRKRIWYREADRLLWQHPEKARSTQTSPSVYPVMQLSSSTLTREQQDDVIKRTCHSFL